MPDVEPALIHWRGCGVSVLINCHGDGLPRILYCGLDLGPLADEDLASVALASLPQQWSNQTDARVEVSVLPEQSRGWMGTPGSLRLIEDLTARYATARVGGSQSAKTCWATVMDDIALGHPA
jgi:hypothetical protein